MKPNRIMAGLLAICILTPGELLMAATGGIVSSTYSGKAQSAGWGSVEVRNSASTDDVHRTQWRLILSTGPEPTWRDVLKYSSSTTGVGVSKRALTYGIEFKCLVAGDVPPATRTITLVDQKKLTLKVHY